MEFHRDAESWGPLSVLVSVDGVGTDVVRFDSASDVDAFMSERRVRRGIGTSWCWTHDKWRSKVQCDCGAVDTVCCIDRTCKH